MLFPNPGSWHRIKFGNPESSEGEHSHLVHGAIAQSTEDFQTSVPGLYVTGIAATRDFGPFYGMIRGCPSSAKIIGGHIQSRLRLLTVSRFGGLGK